METNAALAGTKPRLPIRVVLGLCATGLSVFILVFPGQMALPLAVLTPLMPAMGGCANFLAPLVFVGFFVIAIGISLVLIAIGAVAISLTAARKRGGAALCVTFDALIAMQLLLVPLGLGLSVGGDQSGVSLEVFMAVCAIIPLAGVLLMLAPSVYPSSRAFIATLAVACLLLAPGVFGLVNLGLQVGGVGNSAAPSQSTAGTTAACSRRAATGWPEPAALRDSLSGV